MAGGKSDRGVQDELHLEPLAQVVAAQMPRSPTLDEVTFQRKRDAFTRSLEVLAGEYAIRRKHIDDSREAGVRFDAVASAARKLRLAMDALSDEELGALGIKQGYAFHTCEAELGEAESYQLREEYNLRDEQYRPRSANQMREWRDLYWLEHGARMLIARRERGRPKNSAERWAAERFVVLCNWHGWSSLTVSNSGTEKRASSQPIPSPAVFCLAAVFRAAGFDNDSELARAKSALQALRNGKIHDVDRPSPGDWESDPVPDRYKVSLKVVEALRVDGTIPLPNFIPKGK